jgi:hypothetical protein
VKKQKNFHKIPFALSQLSNKILTYCIQIVLGADIVSFFHTTITPSTKVRINHFHFLFFYGIRNNESGWSSPPRTISDCSPIDQLPMRSPSKPCATTASINNDPAYRVVTQDADIKPFNKISLGNTSRFLEQVQIELDQIKDEYTVKFEKDRKYIEQEVNLLINEERQTLDKLNGYLNDHRRRVDKRNNNNKRKHSPSSSNH